MRTFAIMLLALLTAGCADRAARDDPDARATRAERERDELRDRERECRLAAEQGRSDPRCPNTQGMPENDGSLLPPVAAPQPRVIR